MSHSSAQPGSPPAGPTTAQLYAAGPAGKCKERAYLPPVTNYCPNQEPSVVPGDLDCNGCVDFGDIDPFVMFVSNSALWQATYPNGTATPWSWTA